LPFFGSVLEVGILLAHDMKAGDIRSGIGGLKIFRGGRSGGMRGEWDGMGWLNCICQEDFLSTFIFEFLLRFDSFFLLFDISLSYYAFLSYFLEAEVVDGDMVTVGGWYVIGGSGKSYLGCGRGECLVERLEGKGLRD
jgi:hypothetical protein